MAVDTSTTNPAPSSGAINHIANFVEHSCTAVANGIEKAANSVNQRIQPVKKHFPLIKKIGFVAICVALALTSTLPFCIGLVLGAIYKDKVRAHLMELKSSFNKQPICGKIVLVLAGSICALAFQPVTVLAFSTYAGSNLHKLGKPSGETVKV